MLSGILMHNKLHILQSPIILFLNFLKNMSLKFLHVLLIMLAYIFIEKVVIGR